MNELEFVGARLELARTFHGLTLKALAENVSASFGLLSHYENGLRRHPSADLVGALAMVLKVEPGFFYEPLADTWSEPQCSFRRRATTPEKVKTRARAHGTMISLVIQELAKRVRLPAYKVPSVVGASDNEIEDIARRCRAEWGLADGPIEHIGRVAERNGVILVQNLRHSDKVDAFARRGGVSVIVLNTARASTSRWIFDVAHELGHFVLHEGLETGSKVTEAQANYFAGALLLPRSSFGREFRSKPVSWNHIFEMKRRWFTSAAAIIRRAFDLALLDPVTYRRCYQQMSIRGWLKKEPYEPTFAGPEWLPSAFTVLTKKLGVSIPDFCRQLHFTLETFTEVTGVTVAPDPAQFRPRLVKA